jgi:hypothetical protein
MPCTISVENDTSGPFVDAFNGEITKLRCDKTAAAAAKVNS